MNLETILELIVENQKSPKLSTQASFSSLAIQFLASEGWVGYRAVVPNGRPFFSVEYIIFIFLVKLQNKFTIQIFILLEAAGTIAYPI